MIDLPPGYYTVDELMSSLDIKFSSKKAFGQYMKSLGYISQMKRTNGKLRRVYVIGSIKHLILKQLYLLTKEQGSKAYTSEEIRNWLTIKFGSKKEFGTFMGKLGYSSYANREGRRVYVLTNDLIYPVSRKDRMLNPRSSTLSVIDDGLHPMPWSGIGKVERRINIFK